MRHRLYEADNPIEIESETFQETLDVGELIDQCQLELAREDKMKFYRCKVSKTAIVLDEKRIEELKVHCSCDLLRLLSELRCNSLQMKFKQDDRTLQRRRRKMNPTNLEV